MLRLPLYHSRSRNKQGVPAVTEVGTYCIVPDVVTRFAPVQQVQQVQRMYVSPCKSCQWKERPELYVQCLLPTRAYLLPAVLLFPYLGTDTRPWYRRNLHFFFPLPLVVCAHHSFAKSKIRDVRFFWDECLTRQKSSNRQPLLSERRGIEGYPSSRFHLPTQTAGFLICG